MGDWDKVWQHDALERQAFALGALMLKGFTVDWSTGKIERRK